MNDNLKTLKISEVIKVLQDYKNDLGDIPVFHQSDPEGNSFGTLHPRSFSYDTDTKVGTAMFICPFAEYVEVYDEIF